LDLLSYPISFVWRALESDLIRRLGPVSVSTL
jgi:hypothetical protein